MIGVGVPVYVPTKHWSTIRHTVHADGNETSIKRALLSALFSPHSGATLNMRPAPLPLEEMEWRQTPPPLATTPGTFRLRRGSRFTWRKECLAVMERWEDESCNLKVVVESANGLPGCLGPSVTWFISPGSCVIDSYFNDNQYPDEAKREEIANACNAVIQKPGKTKPR